jgi:hypothetical protein
VDTNGQGGTFMKKSVTVETSAAKQPNMMIEISGNVEKFANITPNKLILRGNAGEPIIGTVTVSPDPRYPFKVLETKSKKGTDTKDALQNNLIICLK